MTTLPYIDSVSGMNGDHAKCPDHDWGPYEVNEALAEADLATTASGDLSTINTIPINMRCCGYAARIDMP